MASSIQQADNLKLSHLLTSDPPVVGEGTYGKVRRLTPSLVAKTVDSRVFHQERKILQIVRPTQGCVTLHQTLDPNLIIMEYAGIPLSQYRPQHSQDLKNVLYQLLQALQSLQKLGICHSDLKPNNLCINAGRLRLIDFGLSGCKQHPHLNPHCMYIPPYKSPLVGLQIQQHSLHNLDMWAAACMIPFLLLGEDLFSFSREDRWPKRLGMIWAILSLPKNMQGFFDEVVINAFFHHNWVDIDGNILFDISDDVPPLEDLMRDTSLLTEESDQDRKLLSDLLCSILTQSITRTQCLDIQALLRHPWFEGFEPLSYMQVQPLEPQPCSLFTTVTFHPTSSPPALSHPHTLCSKPYISVPNQDGWGVSITANDISHTFLVRGPITSTLNVSIKSDTVTLSGRRIESYSLDNPPPAYPLTGTIGQLWEAARNVWTQRKQITISPPSVDHHVHRYLPSDSSTASS